MDPSSLKRLQIGLFGFALEYYSLLVIEPLKEIMIESNAKQSVRKPTLQFYVCKSSTQFSAFLINIDPISSKVVCLQHTQPIKH